MRGAWGVACSFMRHVSSMFLCRHLGSFCLCIAIKWNAMWKCSGTSGCFMACENTSSSQQHRLMFARRLATAVCVVCPSFLPSFFFLMFFYSSAYKKKWVCVVRVAGDASAMGWTICAATPDQLQSQQFPSFLFPFPFFFLRWSVPIETHVITWDQLSRSIRWCYYYLWIESVDIATHDPVGPLPHVFSIPFDLWIFY